MQKAVLHKGLQAKCPVCRPDAEKRERRFRTVKRTGQVTTEVAVRRQVDAELGEDAPPLAVGMMRQKYGTTPARIDKKILLPKWKLKWLADKMSVNSTGTVEAAWQKKQIEWQKSIPKFMIPRYQQKRDSLNIPATVTYPKRYQDRNYRPNSNQTRTETRPN
jgi:hypothetical protein